MTRNTRVSAPGSHARRKVTRCANEGERAQTRDEPPRRRAGCVFRRARGRAGRHAAEIGACAQTQAAPRLLTSRGPVHAPLTALEASPAAAAVGFCTSVKVTPFTHAAGSRGRVKRPAFTRIWGQKTKPHLPAAAAAAAALRWPGRSAHAACTHRWGWLRTCSRRTRAGQPGARQTAQRRPAPRARTRPAWAWPRARTRSVGRRRAHSGAAVSASARARSRPPAGVHLRTLRPAAGLAADTRSGAIAELVSAAMVGVCASVKRCRSAATSRVSPFGARYTCTGKRWHAPPAAI